VLSLRERLSIAHSNVDAARTLMSIVDARFNVGLSNPVEVATQKAALASAELTVQNSSRCRWRRLPRSRCWWAVSRKDSRSSGSPLESLTELP